MTDHYVWLAWSCAFLLPWAAIYLANPGHRKVIWRTSLATALFGLTEPIFVPEYWNPPSLFELAQRTGFDIESLIFSFAIGGIGCAVYETLTKRDLAPVNAAERQSLRHRLHLVALLAPFVLFVPLYFLPWNPIYPSLVTLLIGAVGSVLCRPDLRRKTINGGLLFFGLYAVFMLGLLWSSPGYIERVWNLSALSGILIGGIPLEELLFGLAFGMYWTGVYEHFTWRVTVPRHPEAASASLLASELRDAHETER
ncbi:MAG: lycopene cyclase domain-containing protein [Terriglobales bacterium]